MNHGGIFENVTKLVLEIAAGEGGDDSKIFVHELFSAYVKYAESHKLKVEIVDSTHGNVKAIISGQNAGQKFINEPGKHVCQRIPPTEQKGRKHTSTVSVSVLPFKKSSKIELLDEDLEIEPVNLGGKGGQHQNRSMSGARVTHKPTGLQAVINGRKYHQNLEKALRVLSERVNDKHLGEAQQASSEARQSQMGGGSRSDKIRTYNFLQSRVSDHRLGTKTGNIKGVMRGNFDLILNK